MGGVSGKVSHSDSLAGACTPPLAAVKLPNIERKEKLYNVTVPKFKSGGQECTVTIAGQSFTVKIPPGKKENDSFTISVPDITKIYASSLPTLPGLVVLMAKPMIFSVVAEAFYIDHGNTSSVDLNGLSKKVGKLIQEAQSKILQKAFACGCNAVLGISFTLSNDSSGRDHVQRNLQKAAIVAFNAATDSSFTVSSSSSRDGLQKLICVMASGTPCIVNTAEDRPIASVQAFPENNNVVHTM